MTTDRMQKPVLVLNASYEPINICGARRALVLVLKGVASAEEESTHAIHSARSALRLPSVIRLLEYRRIPHQTRALSRKHGPRPHGRTATTRRRRVPGRSRWNNIRATSMPKRAFAGCDGSPRISPPGTN